MQLIIHLDTFPVFVDSVKQRYYVICKLISKFAGRQSFL